MSALSRDVFEGEQEAAAISGFYYRKAVKPSRVKQVLMKLGLLLGVIYYARNAFTSVFTRNASSNRKLSDVVGLGMLLK